MYDPQSIGGTHVIYVLHDATDPERYGGLPKNPQIPLAYTVWKWLAKPVMGTFALFGLVAFSAVIATPLAPYWLTGTALFVVLLAATARARAQIHHATGCSPRGRRPLIMTARSGVAVRRPRRRWSR